MKVLHVTNAYPTPVNPIYGVFIKEQIESIARIDGVEVDIFFINARENGKLEYLRCVPRLRKKMRGYDIIHCHHAFSAIVALLAKKRKNRIITSFLSTGVTELVFRGPLPFASSLYQYVLRNSTARIFKFGIPAELKNDARSYYIPNGVNMELFKPMDKAEAKRAIGVDPSKRYLLFVSSNYLDRPEKRYDKFVAMLEILKTKYILTDIEPLTLINEKRERVPLYFNAANIHVLCSDIEGSPNSVKESLSCNTPVVATKVGNVQDLLTGVKGSYISNAGTPEELASFCYQILTADTAFDLRGRIADLKLDLESVAERIVSIYRDVMPADKNTTNPK